MIKEFINGTYKYSLASPSVTISKVKINNVDISKYLTNETKIGWYDVSKNSGRDVTNADGTMILNVIATKWRLDLVTRPLTEDELIEFYAQIIIAPTMTVEFLNPFTKTWKTINCYRGDRQVQSMFAKDADGTLVEIYNGVTQAIIEL